MQNDFDWCTHPGCYNHNVSAIVLFGLIQVPIIFSNILGLSKRILYSIPKDKLMSMLRDILYLVRVDSQLMCTCDSTSAYSTSGIMYSTHNHIHLTNVYIHKFGILQNKQQIENLLPQIKCRVHFKIPQNVTQQMLEKGQKVKWPTGDHN